MRRLVAAIAIVCLALVVIPVRADHVEEPHAPIEELRFRAGQYPGLDMKCDGSDVVDFGSLRIEPVLRVSDVPSEHWEVRFHFRSPNGKNKPKLDWDAHPVWHQNRGPHGRLNAEVAQFNHYNIQDRPGNYLMDVKVTGLESEIVLEAECPFRVAP